ncbi:MAG: DMT family protein [Planctomycetota bacterium]
MSDLPENQVESSENSSMAAPAQIDIKGTSSKSIVVYVAVPLMLLLSSSIMATAWLGHLRFKEDLSFWMATLFAWLLVLPEYALNIAALRLGYEKYTGGQMGAFRLCTGVVCIAFVSHYVLGENLTSQKLIGFAIMGLSMFLISNSKSKKGDD